MERWLNAWRSKHGDFHVLSGGANGADSLAIQYAREHDLSYDVFWPEFKKHDSKRAAFLARNCEIVNESAVIIAFWDQQSTGTAHTIGYARKMGRRVVIVNYMK